MNNQPLVGILTLLGAIIFTIYLAVSLYKKTSANDYKLTGKEVIKNLQMIASIVVLDYLLFWMFSSGLTIEAANQKVDDFWFEFTDRQAYGMSYLIPIIILTIIFAFCAVGINNYFEEKDK